MNRLNDIKSFGLWIVKSFRASLFIYVIVSQNSIRVRNIKNGQIASGIAQDEFSSERLLIADPIKAENFTRELIKQIIPNSELKTRHLKVLCHPLDNELADLSPAEKMIFNDFAYHIGGRYVYLIDDKEELTGKELIERNYA